MAKNKGGRPTKLTKQLIEEISTFVRAGNYVEVACGFCGISKETYYQWAKEGNKEREGLKKEFSDAIKKAVAESEIRDLEDIRKDGSWQSKAWRLERRFPERWRQRQSVELGGSVDINKVKKLAEEIMNENDTPATDT